MSAPSPSPASAASQWWALWATAFDDDDDDDYCPTTPRNKEPAPPPPAPPPPATLPSRLRQRLLDVLGTGCRTPCSCSCRVYDIVRLLRGHGDLSMPAFPQTKDACQCAALVSAFLDRDRWPCMIVDAADYVVCKLLDGVACDDGKRAGAVRAVAHDVVEAVTDIVAVVAHAFADRPACRALLFRDFDAGDLQAALAPLTKSFTSAGLARLYVARELDRLGPRASLRLYSRV